jgi:nitroreductase
MSKAAITSAPIAPFLADRWSTRSYDTSYELTTEQALAILEAGRWAPSGNNLQPWRFSLLRRGTDLHQRVSAEGLNGFNQAWAPEASAYIVVSILKFKADGSEYTTAGFNGGLATMAMLTEITAQGLAARVMGGINHERVGEILGLSHDLAVSIIIAVGKHVELTEAIAQDTGRVDLYEREIAARERHALDEIVLHGLEK